MENSWPDIGWIMATCIKAEGWRSPKKHTPAIRLTWHDETGHYEFDDLVFLTKRALKRVALIASRVCGWSDTNEIPDNDVEALQILSDFIIQNAKGKTLEVEIEEQTETFIYESGPDIGRKGEKKRKRVAFNGYRKIVEESQVEEPKPKENPHPVQSSSKFAPNVPVLTEEERDALPF